MSSPKHERDSDKESLTDWTLVDREGTPDKTTREGTGKDDDKDSGKSSSPASPESKEVSKEKNESAGGVEEEDGEELSEDLISMGKRVQDIKASSGSDSSDIETLDCPNPDDCYEDSTQGYSSLHSSLLSSSLSGFTFVEEADEGDVESLASSDVVVLNQESKGLDEETDLSLASSPSLPDDLPAIKPDTQYRHIPDMSLNSRLNVVVALTLACVLGLGLGHFLGWSSRSLWQENLNSAQVRRLRELQDDLLSCINSPPQVDPESGEPEYLPATFIPVLTEVETKDVPNVETFVESLVVPLEDAGVVIDPGHQQHHHHHDQGESRHTYHRHVHTDSMEPTFATLDVLYASSDPVHALGQEQEVRIHSGFPEPSLATTAEDEIVSPMPQPVLPTKTMEPNFNEEAAPTAFPTNSLPPIEFNTEHEGIPAEDKQHPHLQDAQLSGEEDAPVAVENSQIIEALTLENEQLKSEITRLQQENLSPIKISGKDGKNARNLRERITRLLEDNEELRVAVMRQQFDGLADGDTKAFNDALGTNFNLRVSVGKLTHLVPDLTALKVSANDLQKENQQLQKEVGKLRYQEQPLPQELNVVAREVENLKKVVDEASKKKKVPPNYENAKIYLSYMSQVLQTLHDFNEGGLVEKLDVATDVFEGLVPGNVKPPASVEQKLSAMRGKFKQLKSSLASKWEKIKELSRPQHLAQVSQDTLSKMNRVVVNVVNKMKDIGQASIMKRGKASLESTVATLGQSLAALGEQFDKTWKNLEAEVEADDKEDNDKALMESEDDGDVTDEKEETIVDDGEGKTQVTKPKDGKDGTSDSNGNTPNKSKKVNEKTGGSGGGGKGGGRRGGRDGGDDKTDPEEKKSSKEVAQKKTEDKPDGRRDRSRSRMSDKREKKEEQKEKKAKGKEEKAKKKKDKKEKSKKDKKEMDKSRKSKDNKESDHRRENERFRKSSKQEDKRYYKGQYNKYDKKQQRIDDDDDDDDDDDEVSESVAADESNNRRNSNRKLHKQKWVDDDDDDEDDKHTRKYQQKVIPKDSDDDDDDDEDKKKGLLRHWEKPSRKNYRREYPGPKKAFIRRRGKNATVHFRDEDGKWMARRATGREVRRKEEHKADWLFERSKYRSHKREAEHKAEWQFDRARDRKENRRWRV